jgi:hypothetical protein
VAKLFKGAIDFVEFIFSFVFSTSLGFCSFSFFLLLLIIFVYIWLHIVCMCVCVLKEILSFVKSRFDLWFMEILIKSFSILGSPHGWI